MVKQKTLGEKCQYSPLIKKKKLRIEAVAHLESTLKSLRLVAEASHDSLFGKNKLIFQPNI